MGLEGTVVISQCYFDFGEYNDGKKKKKEEESSMFWNDNFL